VTIVPKYVAFLPMSNKTRASGIVGIHTAYRPRDSEANRGCGWLAPIILPRPQRRAYLPRCTSTHPQP
jgi:hypothetical protein